MYVYEYITYTSHVCQALSYVFYLYYLFNSPKQPNKVSPLITPILQVEKLRQRWGNLSKGQWRRWNLNPDSLVPEDILFPNFTQFSRAKAYKSLFESQLQQEHSLVERYTGFGCRGSVLSEDLHFIDSYLRLSVSSQILQNFFWCLAILETVTYEECLS